MFRKWYYLRSKNISIYKSQQSAQAHAALNCNEWPDNYIISLDLEALFIHGYFFPVLNKWYFLIWKCRISWYFDERCMNVILFWAMYGCDIDIYCRTVVTKVLQFTPIVLCENLSSWQAIIDWLPWFLFITLRWNLPQYCLSWLISAVSSASGFM